MTAILVSVEGRVRVVELPETFRGRVYSENTPWPEPTLARRADYYWRSSFARSNGHILFDVFEEG